MRSLNLLAWLSGVLVVLSLDAQAKSVSKTRAQSHTKTKAKAKKHPLRKTASLQNQVVVELHSEHTSFEAALLKREALARRPAGFVATGRVIGMRRDLGLNRREANEAAQDILINTGSNGGVSKGATLKVMRKLPVLDPYKDNQQSELNIPFATLKVVHVEDEIAVARLQSIDPIKSGLTIGTRAVMVGDFVGN